MRSTRRRLPDARLPGAWVLLAALALTACSRHKDPYQDWKPPQLLEEGDRLLRASDLAQAQVVYKRGYDLAQKSTLSAANSQVFVQRMTLIAAARDDVATATKLMPADSMDLRLSERLMLALVHAGKIDEARAMAERLAQRLSARAPEPEDLPYYAIGWISIDRLRTQNVELKRAREATSALVETLKTWVGIGAALPAGPRAWIARYVDHLFDSERSLPAQEIADLVERIDQRTPPPDDKSTCVPFDPLFASLGCLPDWPK